MNAFTVDIRMSMLGVIPCYRGMPCTKLTKHVTRGVIMVHTFMTVRAVELMI